MNDSRDLSQANPSDGYRYPHPEVRKEDMATSDCIFCKLGLGEADSGVLYKDNQVYVVKDIHPQAPVHLLIIPLQHLTSMAEVGHEQEPVMGHIFAVAYEMAQRERINQSGYRLVLNQGRDAGQHVGHTHVHLLGGKGLPALG
jgi:histidine triad (HIT) family protein